LVLSFAISVIVVSLATDRSEYLKSTLSLALSQAGGDNERLKNIARDYQSVYDLSGSELVRQIPQWAFIGSYKLVVGMTPGDAIKIVNIIKNKDYPLWLNWFDYTVIILGSVYNSLILVPILFYFVFRAANERTFDNAAMLKRAFNLFSLIVLVQYALNQGGGSDLRTRQVLITLVLISTIDISSRSVVRSKKGPVIFTLGLAGMLLLSAVLGFS